METEASDATGSTKSAGDKSLANNRDLIAQRQSDLMRALLAPDNSVEGVDTDRLERASVGLRRKRFRQMGRIWPRLMQNRVFGVDQDYKDFVKANLCPHPKGPAADGADFARYLQNLGKLNDGGVAELNSYRFHERLFHANLFVRLMTKAELLVARIFKRA